MGTFLFHKNLRGWRSIWLRPAQRSAFEMAEGPSEATCHADAEVDRVAEAIDSSANMSSKKDVSHFFIFTCEAFPSWYIHVCL